MSAPSRRAVTGIVLGNALEFYDFVTYAFFAVELGRAFFPAGSPTTSLLASLGAFGAGFLARPVGALVLGRYADRAGRRPALRLSFLLMGLATLLLIATPPYAAIGMAAPVMIVLARLVQGFAIGGDAGAATAWLIESAPADRSARYAGWQVLGQQASGVAAGLMGSLVAALLPPESFADWGWRLVMLPGLLVIPAGLWLRAGLHEPLASASARDAGRLRAPVLIGGALLMVSGTCCTYGLIFLTTYGRIALGLSAELALTAPLVVGVVSIAVGLPAAFLSDRIGHGRVVIASCAAFAVAVLPAFLLLVRWEAAAFVGVTALLAALIAPATTVGLVWLGTALPPRLRSTGVALVYALAVTLFGAATQPVLVAAIAATGPLAPGVLLTLAALVGLAGAVLLAAQR